MTVETFEFFTPSADASISVLAEATPTKSNSGPTPKSSPSDTPVTFASHNFGGKIKGIVVGSIAFVFIVGLALACWRARRRTAKANASAPVDMEAVLEEKRKRAESLGIQRWSWPNYQQSLERFQAPQAKVADNAATKKEDPIIEAAEGTIFEIRNPQVRPDRARRPSGLAMHPPTPVTSEFKENDETDVGRPM